MVVQLQRGGALEKGRRHRRLGKLLQYPGDVLDPLTRKMGGLVRRAMTTVVEWK
jgi:hypothetical protein